MVAKFKKDIYPKSALLKSAYNFTDKAYVHIDADECYYIVDIQPKDGETIDIDDFKNEILAQCVRIDINNKTKSIRELILARALASTIVNEKDNSIDDIEESENNIDIDDILKDWFEKHE